MSRVWHAAATASRRRWSREGARLPVQTRGMRVVVVVVCRASLDCTVKYPYIHGYPTSLFRRLADTDVYETGYVKIWKLGTKCPWIYGYFLQCGPTPQLDQFTVLGHCWFGHCCQNCRSNCIKDVLQLSPTLCFVPNPVIPRWSNSLKEWKS